MFQLPILEAFEGYRGLDSAGGRHSYFTIPDAWRIKIGFSGTPSIEMQLPEVLSCTRHGQQTRSIQMYRAPQLELVMFTTDVVINSCYILY